MKFKTLLVSTLALIISVSAVSAITMSVDELKSLMGVSGEAQFGAITTEVPSTLTDGEYTVFNDIFVDNVEINSDLKVGGSITSTDKVSRITATTDALTVAESGTTFYIDLASTTAGSVITLPAVAASAGVSYKFVVAAAFATANVVVDSAEGDNIEGTLLVAGAVVDCDAEDQINFVNDGENLGDYFEIYSDGEVWFLGDSGALTASKLTCTDPS